MQTIGRFYCMNICRKIKKDVVKYFTFLLLASGLFLSLTLNNKFQTNVNRTLRTDQINSKSFENK